MRVSKPTDSKAAKRTVEMAGKKAAAPDRKSSFERKLKESTPKSKQDLPSLPQDGPVAAQPQQPLEGTHALQSAQRPTTPQIDRLVQEILVGVNSRGENEVQIRLNSNTLGGLQIQITRQGEGRISLHFVSQSPEVSSLLSQNVAQLTEALAGQGLQVNQLQLSLGDQVVINQTPADQRAAAEQQQHQHKDQDSESEPPTEEEQPG